jgi:hypothetical protein
MRWSGADRAHFEEDNPNAALRKLECSLRAGEAAADYMNGFGQISVYATTAANDGG